MSFLAVFLVFLLLPGVFSDHTIETESYVLMIEWSIVGLFFFNAVIRKDHARNYGKAIIVLMSITLAERMNEAGENLVMDEISSYMDGTMDGTTLAMSKDEFLEVELKHLHAANNTSVLIIAGLFGLSFAVMLVNYRSMREWERKATDERDHARLVAFKDPLTGVKSKHAFAVREGEIETHIVDGDADEFGVVVCDVNGLKRINDTLGHKAGDEYIRAACSMLCEYFDHSPVYRIGGDEFVVLLQGRDYAARHEILGSI